MKILFFATYPSMATGYSRIGNILSNFLAKSGHDVYYLGISNFKNNVHVPRFIHPNITLLDALEMEKINNSDELYGVNVICELLDKIKPDILFLYNDVIVISRIFNNLIEKKITKNFKIFVYLDLVFEYENFRILNHIHNFSDLILVFSECWKKNLIDMGFSQEKIRILHHGFDKNIFFPLDKTESKKMFGFEKDDFIILNTNRNNYRKSIDKTIDAFIIFLKLKNSDSRIKLFLNMVCNANLEIQGYDIYNLIKISCIKHNVNYEDTVNKHIFVNNKNSTNHISDEMMNWLYNACDIGINTCVGEGFGLCNLEHGGIGKPQIVSGVGALNDIFTNEYSTVVSPVAELYIPNSIDFHGGYIKICSSNDFANGMVKYFDNPELVESHGKTSRELILNNYNWDTKLNELNNIIINFDYELKKL
jgi:glycosyltransferase involved in cell wall biosynthesis